MLGFMDLHRLGEERSLALHARIAERLREDPALVMRALDRIEEWARAGLMDARYAAAWREVLAMDMPSICRFLVDPGERALALRQASPFVGVLTPGERWRIRAEVMRRAGRAP